MAVVIQNASLDEATLRTLDNDKLLWLYNALDCCITVEVAQGIREQMDDDARRIYALSQALQGPILEMTLRGIRIDLARRTEIIDDLQGKVDRLDRQFNRLVREALEIEPINHRSPQQLQHLFYTVLRNKPIKKRNAKGGFSPTTNEEALNRLLLRFENEPFCRHILAIRELEKKIQFLDTQLDPDARIRSSINIAGTNTGRMSSSASDYGTGTNLQNWTDFLRQVFIPDDGMAFCNLDIKQGDSRNIGAACWEMFVDERGPEFAGSYLDACDSDDLHTTVCRMAWHDLEWPEDPAKWREFADQKAYRDYSFRDLAKRLGHGTNYYGQPATMAAHTHLPVPVVEDFQQRYFSRFQCIRALHERVSEQLHATGTVTSIWGRRRMFFGSPSDDDTLRKAIAYVGQSPTADELNYAIINLWRANKVQLLLQVHDSLLFQFPHHLRNEIIPWAVKAAETPLRLKHGRMFIAPFEAQYGFNWGKASASNPDGMKEWKGSDNRKPPKRQKIRIGTS